MQITWNGTGAAWAAHYGNSSAVVESAGTRLLVDCGHTVPTRLARMDLSLRDLDAAFISHLHGDHVYGLEEWGFRNFLMWNIRPKLFIADDLLRPLWNRVLSGTMAQVCDKSCHLDDYFDVVPMQVGKPQEFGPFTLEIRPVRHVPNARSYGVKIATDEGAAGFTCDSLADADSWFYDETRLVFHDCSFAPPFEETVHAHFEQLCAYPREFRARTMLVHYDDSIQQKRKDSQWLAALHASEMRLTDPFAPMKI